MKRLKKTLIIMISVLHIYVMDWAIGWCVVAVTVAVAATAGISYGTVVVIAVWFAVYVFQIILVKTYVNAAAITPEMRSRFQSYVIELTTTMIAPVHGIRALKVRYIQPEANVRPKPKIVALIVGSWAAGSLLFMAYRRERDGALYKGFWNHARIGASVFALRFTLTYAVLPLAAAAGFG